MTLAIRAAETAGIAFTVHKYKLGVKSTDSYGEAVALELGVPPEQVFKTLVVKLDSGQFVVGVVPVSSTLDLKKMASHWGGKRGEMATPTEAERVTGYVTGGISPLGQRNLLPTAIDDSALGFSEIYVSAGKRGLQLALSPTNLIHLTQGIPVSIKK